MRTLLSILFCLFLQQHLQAQILTGIVTDGQTGNALYPAVVSNIRSGQTVYTDEDGKFSITATGGDRIAFSFVGYKPLQWIMPPALSITRQTFEMQPTSYELQEFIVRPRNYTQYQIDSLERRSTYRRTLARQKGGSVMSPVTLVAEKLSRRSRQIYQFQKDFTYWENQRYIDSKYSAELVSELTGLTGDSLAHFMNAYPMPYDYARAATELELKMWIRSNYKEWLRHPVIPVTDTMKAGRR